MQNITPHLWFDTQAKEAVEWYVSLFQNSKITKLAQIKDTPSGDCDMLSFELAGRPFMAISAGPYFTLNPSISFFVTCKSEEEIERLWDHLIEGGMALMPYNSYPWAKKYGWLQDKYGVSWQLSWNETPAEEQKITPMLMFTQGMAGKAKEAIESYTKLFPNSAIKTLVPYEKGDGDTEGFLKHAQFTLNGADFMAIDSSGPHKFTFNEAVSLVVNCDTQEEIDAYWEALSAVPEAEQCGWLKDKYGVSWQIVPSLMAKMMSEGTPEQMQRVTQAFLKMKKFDIQALKAAYSA